MLFSSLIFIFSFLPLLVILYYLSPKKWRNYILLSFSLVFYAWGGVAYSLILVISIIVNFIFVTQIAKKSPRKKAWLSIGITFNVLVIVTFKYLDFLIGNVNALGNFISAEFNALPLQHILLPLGISFFTFQQMSLLWDVYRDEEYSKTRFSDIALYISLFPQLIAGPIVRFKDIADQLKKRVESIDLFRSGIQRFLIGLFKKVIIANTCGELADTIMANPIDEINTPVAWLGILAYTFQIYFDFSGYSDMAIGLGRMFGFKILENFNLPYIATSIQEFWRRWHISLSTWFRDYVYIPLGGNRIGRKRTYVNLIIVFFLTGIWHGATWSFVIWGLFHGFFLILERIGFKKVLDKLPKMIGWTYTLIVVMVGWVMFRIEEFPQALQYIGRLFGTKVASGTTALSYLNAEIIIILLLATLLSSPLVIKFKKLVFRPTIQNNPIFRFALDMTLIGIFIYSVIYINSGSYNPFIYFRF